ncbi:MULTISPECIES: hypothetical protein [unclassified Haladaptatus]|uniref:hypothetical protein n=1 Tax=unclassified Haladaptatus TaxID=2622732 RepID=UPI00209BFE96|nr:MULTISPECIES: hypothetical protein [unclassified Haladaptatus]MCO8243983.1 hypothetical protein [Haladaptatus sp. AB643]MCO8256518.1 hypothetical protein [Haladaptatus sp. AB618]
MTGDDNRPKGAEIQVERVSDGCGIRIWDPIEKAGVVLRTPSRIDPQQGSTEGFPFSVETAVEFRTDRIDIPAGMSYNAWDTSNAIRDTIFMGGGVWEPSFRVGYLELKVTPMRFYIAVDCFPTVRSGDSSSTIEFGEERRITVGVGSAHCTPEGTITVTDDPEDVMRAVSLFGSALGTLSPERSFPTLRGHPPLIERGDEFSSPPDLERPDTGVRLIVPPEREYVYPVVSLAYYLGAEVVPGNHPRLETPDSEYVFGDTTSFEREINGLLRHVFFFDCLTREEGFYPAPLRIRSEIEPLVPFDFESLYDRSLSEQLDAYLDVPLNRVDSHFPNWTDAVALELTARNVEALPYVSSNLAFVRCPSPTARMSRTEPPQTVTDFCRSQTTASGAVTETTVVSIPETAAVHDEWLGEGVPIGGNKVTLDSYRRRTENMEPKTSTISVKIVCNDPQMKAEGKVTDLYMFREITDHEIDIEYDLTVEELASVFAADIDFLHYIGHVNDEGIECTDGVLDTRTLDAVNVELFLLNACRSYDQSMALVEKGCRGGIATLSDVSNGPATEVGSWLARLLGRGFALCDALSIVRRTTLSGNQYVALGDSSATVCRAFNSSNSSVHIDSYTDGVYTADLEIHMLRGHKIGSFYNLVQEDDERFYLFPETVRKEMTAAELDELLKQESSPVEYDGDLYWSDDITAADLH